MTTVPLIMCSNTQKKYKAVGDYIIMSREQAGKALRKIIGEVREGNFPYQEREKTATNWNDYDRAQCHEISDMLILIRESVDFAVRIMKANQPPKNKGPGRPPCRSSDVAKALLLQSYFDVPNRVAEGLLLLFSEKMGISNTFSYKTIERGYDRESVGKILDTVFKLTNEPVRGLEKVFSVDGSGSPTNIRQNYARDRQIQRRGEVLPDDSMAESISDPKHDYVYKLAIVGTKYKLFAGWRSTTDHSIGETSMFPGVMADAIENHPNMEQMLGDGIYATRPICKLVGRYNVTPRFLPRRNIIMRSKGVKEWAEMLWELYRTPQEWLREYHMRSISETGFSMLNVANTGPLRKRLDRRRTTEDYLRGVCHNIRRLCYLFYLEGINAIQTWQNITA